MRLVLVTLALFALSPLACNSGGSNTLTGGQHGGGGGGGGDSGGSSSDDGGGGAVDSYAAPVDGQLMDDGSLGIASPCDPNNDMCPTPLLCCTAHGGVREGGVYFACQRPTGADGGCP